MECYSQFRNIYLYIEESNKCIKLWETLIASKMWWLWHKSIVLITQTRRMLKSVDQVKQAYIELRKTDIVKGALTNECRGTTEDNSPSKVNEMCYHVAVTLADYSRIFHDFLCWLLFQLPYIKRSSYWTRVEQFSATKGFVTVLAIHTWHSAMGNEKIWSLKLSWLLFDIFFHKHDYLYIKASTNRYQMTLDLNIFIKHLINDYIWFQSQFN